MYRYVWIGIAAAAVVVNLAGCGAPGQRPEAIREATEIHGEVTVAGCLQHDAEASRFVLTNAKLAYEQAGIPVRDGTELPPAAAGAPTTTGTVPPVLAGPRYVVEPPANVNLPALSNVEVQVTGTLAPLHESERPVGTTGTDAGVRTEQPVEVRGVDGHLVANEVRLVADTCM
jgi:hypothetical protein